MYTVPTPEVLKELQEATPDYMYPSGAPWLVISEEHLSPSHCQEIIDVSERTTDSYRFPKCKADTRELPRPLDPVFGYISSLVEHANREYWQYAIHTDAAAWMQTYVAGDQYELHMDGSAGQTRKLTAILQLSEPSHYVGGELVMWIPPHQFVVPRTQGTIVIFPHWVMHYVQEVKSGRRQTINLGHWGPPFR